MRSRTICHETLIVFLKNIFFSFISFTLLCNVYDHVFVYTFVCI